MGVHGGPPHVVSSYDGETELCEAIKEVPSITNNIPCMPYMVIMLILTGDFLFPCMNVNDDAMMHVGPTTLQMDHLQRIQPPALFIHQKPYFIH